MKSLMEYYILTEGYKEAKRELADHLGGEETVANAMATSFLNSYRELVNKNQFSGDERNIDYWRKQGWNAFIAQVRAVSAQATKTQRKKNLVPGKSITLADDETWHIVVPLDEDAARFYGKDTKWCTTMYLNNHFGPYFNHGDTIIYCINKQSGKKWAIQIHSDIKFEPEYFDARDNEIGETKFAKQTALNPQLILQMVDKVAAQINSHRKEPEEVF